MCLFMHEPFQQLLSTPLLPASLHTHTRTRTHSPDLVLCFLFSLPFPLVVRFFPFCVSLRFIFLVSLVLYLNSGYLCCSASPP